MFSRLLGRSLASVAKRRKLKAPLTISERAADRLSSLLSSQPEGTVVVLGVKKRGCNGLSYTMRYAEEKDLSPFDDVVRDKGVAVAVDGSAFMHVVGTEMDFVETDLSAEFVFNNPNVMELCGCGESFNTRDQGGMPGDMSGDPSLSPA